MAMSADPRAALMALLSQNAQAGPAMQGPDPRIAAIQAIGGGKPAMMPADPRMASVNPVQQLNSSGYPASNAEISDSENMESLQDPNNEMQMRQFDNDGPDAETHQDEEADGHATANSKGLPSTEQELQAVHDKITGASDTSGNDQKTFDKMRSNGDPEDPHSEAYEWQGSRNNPTDDDLLHAQHFGTDGVLQDFVDRFGSRNLPEDGNRRMNKPNMRYNRNSSALQD